MSDEKTLPGINVLLIGPAGTGKTHSLATAVEAGLDVFVLMLESGVESLYGYWRDKGKPVPDNLHVHVLAGPKASFLEMIDTAKKINTMSFEVVTKLQDPNRSKHNQFITLLEALNDFPDDRTGKTYGCVDTWGPDKMLCIDGMTGVNNASMSMVIGGKPVKNQADWGISQDQVERLIRKLCDGCACHFVIIGHVERETDAVLGGTKLMVASLGKALAPKLPPMFSDVILAVRTAEKWVWDTGNPMADVKARNMPFAGNQPADFRPLIAKWNQRKESEVKS